VLILDYKYSRRQRVRDRVKAETLLQAPLYVLAAERVLQERVTGVYYCSLRGEIYYAGWNIEESRLEIKAEPLTREWLAAALEAARRGWGEIREGRIAPHPADPNLCPVCDFRDVCRYKATPQALVASEELP
jgi:CRISPR/Cas system-associated exonuclease Cas4 (RecB family)